MIAPLPPELAGALLAVLAGLAALRLAAESEAGAAVPTPILGGAFLPAALRWASERPRASRATVRRPRTERSRALEPRGLIPPPGRVPARATGSAPKRLSRARVEAFGPGASRARRGAVLGPRSPAVRLAVPVWLAVRLSAPGGLISAVVSTIRHGWLYSLSARPRRAMGIVEL
jgi:hypothetical protein